MSQNSADLKVECRSIDIWKVLQFQSSSKTAELGAELFRDKGQTDRNDITKWIVAFLSFAKAFKKCIFGGSRSVFSGRGQLKCDVSRAETRFRLSAKRTSQFKSAGGRQFSRLPAAEVCPSAVVMLDTPCSEVVWRVLATHSIRQFPLHFPSGASPCAITFQLDSTVWLLQETPIAVNCPL